MLACRFAITRDLAVTAQGQGKPDDVVPEGFPAQGPLAAAVDIGTTTVRISLVDTTGGKVSALTPYLNPQRRYGHDVVSRIAASVDTAALTHMGALIRSAVRNSLDRVLRSSGVPCGRMKRLALSGNTTMLYLFFVSTGATGQYPYQAPSGISRHAAETSRGLGTTSG